MVRVASGLYPILLFYFPKNMSFLILQFRSIKNRTAVACHEAAMLANRHISIKTSDMLWILSNSRYSSYLFRTEICIWGTCNA